MSSLQLRTQYHYFILSRNEVETDSLRRAAGRGCYVGQELVERIDSRGSHAPKRLCRLVERNGITPLDTLDLSAITSTAWRNLAASGPMIEITSRLIAILPQPSHRLL